MNVVLVHLVFLSFYSPLGRGRQRSIFAAIERASCGSVHRDKHQGTVLIPIRDRILIALTVFTFLCSRNLKNLRLYTIYVLT